MEIKSGRIDLEWETKIDNLVASTPGETCSLENSIQFCDNSYGHCLYKIWVAKLELLSSGVSMNEKGIFSFCAYNSTCGFNDFEMKSPRPYVEIVELFQNFYVYAVVPTFTSLQSKFNDISTISL